MRLRSLAARAGSVPNRRAGLAPHPKRLPGRTDPAEDGEEAQYEEVEGNDDDQLQHGAPLST